jgi:hypothetical protein
MQASLLQTRQTLQLFHKVRKGGPFTALPIQTTFHDVLQACAAIHKARNLKSGGKHQGAWYARKRDVVLLKKLEGSTL